MDERLSEGARLFKVLVDKDLRLLRKVGQAVPHDAIVGRSYAPRVSTASSDGEGQ